jgi:D-alanine-D-alanine ligase
MKNVRAEGDNEGNMFEDFTRLMVAVVGGGLGPEREGSIISAGDVHNALTTNGVKCEYVDLADIAETDMRLFDIAFLLTHGQWGEDGRLQGYLETLRIPFTGPRTLGCAMSMDKLITNALAIHSGISVPKTLVLHVESTREDVARALAQIGEDAIIRPTNGGGSLGVLRTGSPDAIVAHMRSLSDTFGAFLLTEYITGTEISAAYADRDGTITAFPLLATYHDDEFYNYRIKHDPVARTHVCPADLRETTVSRINDLCPLLYRRMNLSGFVRFDFIVDTSGQPWFLEVNAIPGMSRNGNLATMARAAGLSYDELILLQLQMCVRRQDIRR